MKFFSGKKRGSFVDQSDFSERAWRAAPRLRNNDDDRDPWALPSVDFFGRERVGEYREVSELQNDQQDELFDDIDDVEEIAFTRGPPPGNVHALPRKPTIGQRLRGFLRRDSAGRTASVARWNGPNDDFAWLPRVQSQQQPQSHQREDYITQSLGAAAGAEPLAGQPSRDEPFLETIPVMPEDATMPVFKIDQSQRLFDYKLAKNQALAPSREERPPLTLDHGRSNTPEASNTPIKPPVWSSSTAAQNTRPVAKVSNFEEFSGAHEAQNHSVLDVREDSSIGATPKLPKERSFFNGSTYENLRKTHDEVYSVHTHFVAGSGVVPPTPPLENILSAKNDLPEPRRDNEAPEGKSPKKKTKKEPMHSANNAKVNQITVAKGTPLSKALVLKIIFFSVAFSFIASLLVFMKIQNNSAQFVEIPIIEAPKVIKVRPTPSDKPLVPYQDELIYGKIDGSEGKPADNEEHILPQTQFAPEMPVQSDEPQSEFLNYQSPQPQPQSPQSFQAEAGHKKKMQNRADASEPAVSAPPRPVQIKEVSTLASISDTAGRRANVPSSQQPHVPRTVPPVKRLPAKTSSPKKEVPKKEVPGKKPTPGHKMAEKNAPKQFFYIHLGSFQSQQRALREIVALKRRFPVLLQHNVSIRIEKQKNRQNFYGILVGPLKKILEANNLRRALGGRRLIQGHEHSS
ncbi:MAG: hypothetical protein LBF84_02850 [Holosporales bacterium]|nr:hypothetical protein [Holosporales bacterium]